MDPERWRRIKELLESSLALPVAARAGHLAESCAGDPAMQEEVESLLASYEDGGDLLEAPAMAREESIVGRRLGPYRVFHEIGRGGMGAVYLAFREDDFTVRVAIKLVKRGMDTDDILRRFYNERQILACLRHPNIASLLDGGTSEDGLPYFVMEYVEGKPIDEYCESRKLSYEQRLRLFLDVCAPLRFAHENLVVHRDIKPGNILITEDGQPKLLDFGIAKILSADPSSRTDNSTATILQRMTPEYASPEQVRGERVTGATDVYSLGVLLFKLLTGSSPYRVTTASREELARAISETEPRKASEVAPAPLRRKLYGDLDNILLMALRKEPQRRYASVEQFADDVRRYLDGRPVIARKDTLTYRTAKLVRRHKTAALSAAIMAPVLAILIVLVVHWTHPENVLLQTSPPAPHIVPFTSFPGDENQASFSPDGTRMVFVWGGEHNENSDIYVKPLAGPGLVRITTNPAEDVSPVWSPDGRRIAFLRSSAKETAIFVSPAEGGVHGKIADVYPNRIEAVGRHLDWSPDGVFLAVTDKNTPEEPFSIVLVRADNGQKSKLTIPPAKSIGDTSPAFSPDGKSLSFIRSPSSGVNDLFVISLADARERRLTFDHRVIMSQAWTADGRHIVFSSNRAGSHSLWRVPIHGGAPARLPGIGANVADPSFSRDGHKMVYAQFFQDTNIWRLPLSGPGIAAGPPRALVSSTQYDSSPQFSPDGKRIAFRSSRSGSNEIWVCDSDGHNAVQLTNVGRTLTGTPRWSPDGRWMAFDSRPEGQADIFVISTGGGAPRRITEEVSEDVVPSWSRDGRWIYFASSRSGTWQVWKVPFGGGPKIQVTRNGGFAAFESPDGKYVYYAKGRGVPGLWKVPAEGGQETPVLPSLKAGYWGYWAVVPAGIYFADTPGIYFLPFATGRVKLVARVEKPFIPGDSAFAVSPDGRVVLYTQVDQSGSDLMIAE